MIRDRKAAHKAADRTLTLDVLREAHLSYVAALAVLDWVVDHSKVDGTTTAPRGRIAKGTHLNERTVQRALVLLIATGLLSRIAGGNGRGWASVYRLGPEVLYGPVQQPLPEAVESDPKGRHKGRHGVSDPEAERETLVSLERETLVSPHRDKTRDTYSGGPAGTARGTSSVVSNPSRSESAHALASDASTTGEGGPTDDEQHDDGQPWLPLLTSHDGGDEGPPRHPHEPNALRAIIALRAPFDVFALLRLAYRLGQGDPWQGYLNAKVALEGDWTGVRDTEAVLAKRLGLTKPLVRRWLAA